MRATVTDANAIAALKPQNIIGYLKAKGWTKYSEKRGAFSVWINDRFPDAEVVVPSKREASDFVTRLGSILPELESAEQRSQVDILRDLLNSGFDIMRLAARSPFTTDGSIRIGDGVHLFEHAREMLLAGACAAVKPRAVFHSRKPQPALEYMDQARLGQTEHGSYVLTILSPVAPLLHAYSDEELFPEEPFARRVVKTLTKAIALTVDAADAAIVDTDFSPFQNAVQGGVSANLCEALAGFFKISDPTEMSFSVGWALNRPMPEQEAPGKITITNDIIPMIEEAAKTFRQKDTLEAYPVTGPVVKLERPENSESGVVTIWANVEGVVRKLNLTLNEAEYKLATEAHKNYSPIKVVGDVKKQGRSYVIANPINFDVIKDSDDADAVEATIN
ncbi:hypothetical protein ABAC460_14450 [Asticcacaulis sp. AC460]|uniref:hypothetical protein n=1 Tax=Asticcacaulis sp. AC460 TaxID=1282360 RepID=UPI0003C3CD0B|nr:hypothetical protein [Asticcacaulis sp. AC460]ESQ88978.1 hypothetical protein ABAC460_14450 [Asticcacaulis sp. AC460]